MQPIRIGLICEGATDHIVLGAVLDHDLDDYELTLIQPEQSDFAGGDAGPFGGGWKGVRGWCQHQSAPHGLSANSVFKTFDLLILHVDADIAPDREVNAARPCPPVLPVLEALEVVVLAWLHEPLCPERLVLCTPAQATEAWMLCMLFPDDRRARSCRSTPAPRRCVECLPSPHHILSTLPKAVRLHKHAREYRPRTSAMTAGWPIAVERCVSAARFDERLRAVLVAAAPP